MEIDGKLFLIDFETAFVFDNLKAHEIHSGFEKILKDSLNLYKDRYRKCEQSFDISCPQEYFSKELIGTPYYMSPNVIQSISIHPSNDYWSLGIMMYRMVMGSFPFRGSSREIVF